jgi:PHD/YefM family antitoxin component YafN of YafNO toxin-antitoxin module
MDVHALKQRQTNNNNNNNGNSEVVVVSREDHEATFYVEQDRYDQMKEDLATQLHRVLEELAKERRALTKLRKRISTNTTRTMKESSMIATTTTTTTTKDCNEEAEPPQQENNDTQPPSVFPLLPAAYQQQHQQEQQHAAMTTTATATTTLQRLEGAVVAERPIPQMEATSEQAEPPPGCFSHSSTTTQTPTSTMTAGILFATCHNND